MWNLLSGISLTLCLFAMADDTPLEPSVSVECCGRLRHGMVAIGGETTGTTITFDRTVWELKLPDEAAREFATKHHKETVIVTGRLRKISATEVKDRWIIDVKTLSKRDRTKDEEGTRLSIQGTLRTSGVRQGDLSELTIHADGQIWPIDLSSDARLRGKAESLIGRSVFATGSLNNAAKEGAEDESSVPLVVRIKTLKQSADMPARGHE